MRTRQRLVRALLLAALAGAAATASAQGQGYWQGQEGGPGYGQGYGRPMGPGYGPGYGQGYGPGPGMGGQGYGPGYGRGMGPDYGSQGYGPRGPGMMRGPDGARPERGAGRWQRMARVLGLNEDQRAKIGRIFEDTRRKNWDVIGQIQSERYKLREMMRGDKVDANAAVAQKRKVDELQLKLMQARLEARNQTFALLTPEQREKARSFGPGRRGRGPAG